MSAPRALRRLLSWEAPDPVGFWSARAGDPGSYSVMWPNAIYNELAEQDQWRAVERNLPDRRGAVLDLGCGTGRFTPRLARVFDRYVGVDLPPMVEEARRRLAVEELDSVELVGSKVQDYELEEETFDLILSMACLGSACTSEELPEIASRLAAALRPRGSLVLIDPFHTFAPLVRTCRLRSAEVVNLFTSLGCLPVERGGIHCIPIRLIVARPIFERLPAVTRWSYRIGEAVAAVAPSLLGDYGIYSFRKQEAPR
ncbi:MAG TPA: class I SAM-dependent methyltransferase [Thermoanaerobaculia bacterium]|nr:class I SAM-dependent methyltransferase [Thermoanaerobaculia bacterium]